MIFDKVMFRKCKILFLNTLFGGMFLSALSSLILLCGEFLFSIMYDNLIYKAIHC